MCLKIGSCELPLSGVVASRRKRLGGDKSEEGELDMNPKRAAIMAAIMLLVLLAAAVPSVAFACGTEGECGVCTDAAPVCCVANANGIGVCVLFADNGSPGAEPSTSSGYEVPRGGTHSGPTITCRKGMTVPTVGGFTLEQVQWMADQDTDRCPDTYRRIWPPSLGRYKFTFYNEVR